MGSNIINKKSIYCWCCMWESGLIIFRHWEISSYHHHLHQGLSKRILIFWTRVTERVSFSIQTPQPALLHFITLMWWNPSTNINNKKMKKNCWISPRGETKELYIHRIKNKRLYMFYFNSFVSATAYFVFFLFEAFDFFVVG